MTDKVTGSAPVERTNPLPLYHQIATVLRHRIDAGEWRVGDRLPAEAALASSFSVSTVTMRQALGLIEREGRLIRRQGIGTFVADSGPSPARVNVTIPLEALTVPAMGMHVRALSLETVPAPSYAAESLQLRQGEPCVKVRRVRSTPDRPITYSTTYLPLRVGEGIALDAVQDSLMIEILSSHGWTFRGAVQTMEASLADPDTADVLTVPVGSPILRVQRLYELDDGQPGFLVVNQHPGHEIRYEIKLTLDESGYRAGPDRS